MNNDKLKKIKKEFERISRQHNGLLTPEDVVKEARSPGSILHEEFVWDNTEAAHLYRLQQARILIKQVVVEVVRSDEQTVTVPAFIRSPDGNGYMTTQKVAINTPDRMSVVLIALQQVSTILRNLAAPEVDNLLKRTDNLITALREKHKAA